MRDRWSDVTVIGRDLLRVLQNVARVPDFERLWADIVHDPKSLHPTFGGVTQLMHTRTSRRFLQSRITPEMEKKLVFLTSQVGDENRVPRTRLAAIVALTTPSPPTLQGTFWHPQTLPRLVPAPVPLDDRVPVSPLRPHPLHRRRHPSHQRTSGIRYHSEVGRHRVAPHHVHQPGGWELNNQQFIEKNPHTVVKIVYLNSVNCSRFNF